MAVHPATPFGGDARLGIVLGAAIGYGYDAVMPLVGSLRQAGFGGPIVLIMGKPTDKTAIQRLQAHRVTIVCVRTHDDLALSGHPSARAIRFVIRSLGIAPAIDLMPPSNRRWLLYAKVQSLYDRFFENSPWVFLCDVRDIHAQADPSAIFSDLVGQAPIHLFAEGPPRGTSFRGDPVRIGDEPYTASWVHHLGGDEALTTLADRPVLCSGTVLVTPNRLAELSAHMVRTLATHRFRGAPWGLDQGALNLLYHTGALDGLSPRVHPNGAGGLVTVNLCPRELLTISGDHLSLNGTKPAIVHQYDRIPALERAWRS